MMDIINILFIPIALTVIVVGIVAFKDFLDDIEGRKDNENS